MYSILETLLLFFEESVFQRYGLDLLDKFDFFFLGRNCPTSDGFWGYKGFPFVVDLKGIVVRQFHISALIIIISDRLWHPIYKSSKVRISDILYIWILGFLEGRFKEGKTAWLGNSLLVWPGTILVNNQVDVLLPELIC